MKGVFTDKDIKLYKIKDNLISGYIPITSAYLRVLTKYYPHIEDYIGIAYISGRIHKVDTYWEIDDKIHKYNDFIYKVYLENIKVNKIFMWSDLQRPGIWVGDSNNRYRETMIIGDDFTANDFNRYGQIERNKDCYFYLYIQLHYKPQYTEYYYMIIYPTLDNCLQSIYPNNYKNIQYVTINKSLSKAEKEYLDIPIFAKCKYYDKALRRDGFTRTFVEEGLTEFRICKNSYVRQSGNIIIADKVIPKRILENPYLGGFPSRPFLQYNSFIEDHIDIMSINSTPLRFKFGYKFMTYNAVPHEFKKYIHIDTEVK